MSRDTGRFVLFTSASVSKYIEKYHFSNDDYPQRHCQRNIDVKYAVESINKTSDELCGALYLYNT